MSWVPTRLALSIAARVQPCGTAYIIGPRLHMHTHAHTLAHVHTRTRSFALTHIYKLFVAVHSRLLLSDYNQVLLSGDNNWLSGCPFAGVSRCFLV